MSVNPGKVSEIIVECAERYVLPRFRNLQKEDIRAKTGPNDLVTQADLDVEEHLKRVLPGLIPGSVVLGEEGVSKGEASLEILNDGSRAVWVVDPVDGTNNFAGGRREFAVMLALVQDGAATHAWIYDVLGQEMFVAVKGAGAQVNGQPLRVAQDRLPEPVNGFLNARFFPPKFYEDFDEEAHGARVRRPLFCAGHEYMAVARGEAHFVVFSRMKPWDHVPGILLVQEAGGYASKWDGSAYKPTDNRDGLIAASSPDISEKVLKLFIKNNSINN